MKIYLFLISFLFLAGCSTLQKVDTGTEFKEAYNYKKAILPASLAFASGVAYGFHETSVHHPDRYPDSWDPQFWDNRESWRNKYRNGDPACGAAFFGSRTFLAWTTDSKHLFGTLHRTTMFGTGVTLTIGKRRPAWHYLADAAISFAAFSIGFHSIYTITFR